MPTDDGSLFFVPAPIEVDPGFFFWGVLSPFIQCRLLPEVGTCNVDYPTIADPAYNSEDQPPLDVDSMPPEVPLLGFDVTELVPPAFLPFNVKGFILPR